MLGHFIFRNSWINNYFPNYKIKNEERKKSGKGFIILKPVNLAIMSLYRIMYRSKIVELGSNGSMVIKENCLKLHSNDNRFKISAEFQKSWNEYRESKKRRSKIENYSVIK